MGEAIFGKVVINGKIKLKTGLHIGAQTEAIEIGGIDNPVLKDPNTGDPYIPGSSLKGKMRSLFEKAMSADQPSEKRGWGDDKWFNRKIGDVWIHACNKFEDAVKCPVCRLFGTSGKSGGDKNYPSRTIFRDAYLCNKNELEEAIEIKYETAIDRITSAANPRPMERVVPGAEFAFEIVYNVENEAEKKDDLKNLINLMKMLEDDYLGGSGSRGYGKVEFRITGIVERPKDYYLKEGYEIELLRNDEGLRPEDALSQITEKL
uniref:CRISPR system Cms endoribonuclease Csm3 n=1 Tax=Archaeoglobus fulgidus TaxID=2234 RepID=A0A7C3VID9_ARCFL